MSLVGCFPLSPSHSPDQSDSDPFRTTPYANFFTGDKLGFKQKETLGDLESLHLEWLADIEPHLDDLKRVHALINNTRLKSKMLTG